MKALKMFCKICLLVIQCIGYLLLVISLLWLFFDVFDSKKK